MRKIICLIILAICLTAFVGCNKETRRTIGVYNNGNHIMMPNVGDCDKDGCVISEHYTIQWNGVKWIHQRIDTDKNGVCDILRVWKPLEDPKYGLYYTIYANKPCREAI